MRLDVARAVCGLAVPFGVPGANGRHRFEAEHFATWLELEPALDMRWEHAAVHRPVQAVQLPSGQVQYRPSGLDTSVGRWHRFVPLTTGLSVPAGLLTIGEVHTGAIGDSLLRAVQDGRLTGLSLGVGLSLDDDGDVVSAWPSECSLTPDPAFADALVVGTGRAAMHLFEMLSGQVVEEVKA